MGYSPGDLMKTALLIGINEYPNLGARYYLDGCINDVDIMGQVLKQNFGFSDKEIIALRNEQATRQGILDALDRLVQNAARDGTVIIYFSGHGSRRRNPEGNDGDGFDETIVPYDSGRFPLPNHDIADKEIYVRLLKLTDVTQNVSLIFDCCHSGTIARQAIGVKQRYVEPDLRPLEGLSPSTFQPAFTRTGTRDLGPSGWLPLSKRYVLLAACRDEESAFEYNANGVAHGAFTFFLCEEMARIEAGSTYRDLFERASIRVTSEYPRQHPQMEGAWDRILLGIDFFEPQRYVPVKYRDGETVKLSAGRAQGMAEGSKWTVYPQGTKQTEGVEPLGSVEVSSVRAVSSDARIIGEVKAGAIVAGSRAIEAEHFYGEMRLIIKLHTPPGFERVGRELADLIDESMMLRLAEEGEEGRVKVGIILPGDSVEPGETAAPLSQTDEPVWAVFGTDRLLHIPARKLNETFKLRDTLVKMARYKNALALRNADQDSALKGAVGFVIKRRVSDVGWEPVEPQMASGHVVLHEGERIALEITNNHNAPIYFGILDFGLTGAISLLYPPQGANEQLAAGRSINIGTRAGQEIELFFPDNFPYVADPHGTDQKEGTEVFKLFASTHEIDLSQLMQAGYRHTIEEKIKGADLPLVQLLRTALWGYGQRDAMVVNVAANEEWTTVERQFILRKR